MLLVFSGGSTEVLVVYEVSYASNVYGEMDPRQNCGSLKHLQYKRKESEESRFGFCVFIFARINFVLILETLLSKRENFPF